MRQITIVGMGPGSHTHLTMEAYTCLTSGDCIYLRTSNHPVVRYLVEQGMRFKSFDGFYETAETFEETYQSIANAIIDQAQREAVVYAVPGNPFVAEKTVKLIMDAAKELNIPVKVMHGVSFIDAIVTALAYDPVYGWDIRDALSIAIEDIQPRKDQLWIQVYSAQIASDLKLKLMMAYDDNTEVIIIQGAGIPGIERIQTRQLYELDHDASLFNHLTSVFVPKPAVRKYDIFDLLSIMKTLRSENGCPWDKEQSHESLTPYLIEEAYEVKHAVDHEDDEALADELGDVLLQVVFHATIAQEDGYFEWTDILRAICEKMIRRHPHVFSDAVANTSEQVLKNWQEIKDSEKKHQSVADSMKGVATSLPSLLRSVKVQKKASEVGFDWKHPEDALDKIIEEVNELKAAIIAGDIVAIKEELGDVLLIVSNVSKLLAIDPEQCLNDALSKFIRRFKYVEDKMIMAGIALNPSNNEMMEQFWSESKKTLETIKK